MRICINIYIYIYIFIYTYIYLQALATAEGNLLENTSLIESLSRTKEKSAEIEGALVSSAQVILLFLLMLWIYISVHVRFALV
jgi:hypothetical protein